MGEGRHRADPKGHGHYLVAALGVFLLVALLAGGGFTLHGALTTKPTPPPAAVDTEAASPSPDSSVFAAASPGASQRASRDDPPPTLLVRVTGDACYLRVTTAAGDVLFDDTLTQGDRYSTDEAELKVTIGDTSAAEVFVHGERRDSRRQGGPDNFDVDGDE